MGTWRIYVTVLQTPTGDTVLVPAGGGVGTYAFCNTIFGPPIPPLAGTIEAACDAEPVLYLDGAVTPINSVTGIPAGWTPDSAFVFHHLVFAGANETTHFALSAVPVSFDNAAFNITVPQDQALVGMTTARLQLCAGTSHPITITFATPDAGQGNDVYLWGFDVITGADPDYRTWLSGTYTTTPPVVTRITPNAGSINGGQAAMITGVGLLAATAVTLGGTAVTSFVIVNDTTITIVTPAHASGVVDLVVTGVGTLTGAYTYQLVRQRLPPIPVNTPTVNL